MQFSKNLSKQKKQAQMLLELKLKQLEESDTILSSNNEYLQIKLELENILNTKTEGIRIRAKCNEYEHNERSTKYFLNLEKRNGKQALFGSSDEKGQSMYLNHFNAFL